MKPRALRVLCIDDNPVQIPGAFTFVYPGGSTGIHDRAYGYEGSQRHWANFRDGSPPDIVLVDINFEADVTSPFPPRSDRPTGLLHALPFLAWCRTCRAPSAIAFHTADSDLFARDSIKPEIRALAVEVAALARALVEGDESPLVQSSDVNWDRFVCELARAESASAPSLATLLWSVAPSRVRSAVKSAAKAGGVESQAIVDLTNWLNKQILRDGEGTLIAALRQGVGISRALCPDAGEALVRLRLPASDVGQIERSRLVRQVIDAAFPDAFRPSFQVAASGQSSMVLTWVKSRTTPDAKSALRGAVSRYREMLAMRSSPAYVEPDRIVIDPTALAQLRQQCELAGANGAATPDIEALALGFMLPDGRRESISLRSLFGEVLHFSKEDFLTRIESTAVVVPAWRLLGGRPQIAAYLRILSGWGEVYDLAVSLMGNFPLDTEEGVARSLNNFNVGEHAKLVRFLVLMFQIVRLHKAAWDEWAKAYINVRWDVKKARFGGQGSSFREFVCSAWEAVQASTSDSKVSEVELIAKRLGLRIRRHVSVSSLMPALKALQSLGLVEIDDSSEALRRIGVGFDAERVPACPPELAATWVTYGESGGGAIAALCQTLGFSDRNLLYRIPKYVGAEDDFFTALYTEGRCSGWVRELCGTYARDVLDWDEPMQWPRFMRGQ